ncbi:hypothetical protein ACNQVK_24990 [Mycobacterium sp. 134]|uniref:hypothetical protein n=1 Tax=Mycobacterium sp. 134 TaxID=3400425 RepID=UPI003AAA5E19
MPTKAILRHVRVETPRTNHERLRAAHRRGSKAHLLLARDTHLVIVENDNATRYCLSATAGILNLAYEDLNGVRRQLGV